MSFSIPDIHYHGAEKVFQENHASGRRCTAGIVTAFQPAFLWHAFYWWKALQADFWKVMRNWTATRRLDKFAERSQQNNREIISGGDRSFNACRSWVRVTTTLPIPGLRRWIWTTRVLTWTRTSASFPLTFLARRGMFTDILTVQEKERDLFPFRPPGRINWRCC